VHRPDVLQRLRAAAADLAEDDGSSTAAAKMTSPGCGTVPGTDGMRIGQAAQRLATEVVDATSRPITTITFVKPPLRAVQNVRYVAAGSDW
jgi:hypothetical protein